VDGIRHELKDYEFLLLAAYNLSERYHGIELNNQQLLTEVKRLAEERDDPVVKDANLTNIRRWKKYALDKFGDQLGEIREDGTLEIKWDLAKEIVKQWLPTEDGSSSNGDSRETLVDEPEESDRFWQTLSFEHPESALSSDTDITLTTGLSRYSEDIAVKEKAKGYDEIQKQIIDNVPIQLNSDVEIPSSAITENINSDPLGLAPSLAIPAVPPFPKPTALPSLSTMLAVGWPLLVVLGGAAALVVGPPHGQFMLGTVDLGNRHTWNILLGLIILVGLALPAFRDYSQFFPEDLEIWVYFDLQGLRNAVKTLNTREQQQLNIDPLWHDSRSEYFNEMNLLFDLYGEKYLSSSFPRFNEQCAGHGSLTFLVRRIEGWQRYEIKNSKGELIVYFDTHSAIPQPLRIDLQLVPGEANIIQGSLIDVYYRFGQVLSPMFQQSLYTRGKDFHISDILCVTKIRFFPIVDLGTTIYFWKASTGNDSIHGLIPIGYARYQPKRK